MASLAGNIYRLLLAATLVSLGVAGSAQPAAAASTTRVSVDSAGRQANGPSSVSAISADGRFVAFESDATNLVAGDTNVKRGVFIHDFR